MHQFILVIFSLLVFSGLQVSVESAGICSERSTNRRYVLEQTVSNGGGRGTWGHIEMCPNGTFAKGFSLRVEDHVGDGDDTALNGIRLHCVGILKMDHYYGSVQSVVGSWGRWTNSKWCPTGFLSAFQLRVETSQGNGDDTAANNIKFKCSEGPVLTGDGTGWGEWGGWSQRCRGTGICGIKTRVEGPQGSGDDTALNDVVMYCCD